MPTTTKTKKTARKTARKTAIKAPSTSLSKVLGAEVAERVEFVRRAFDESSLSFAWGVMAMVLGGLELARLHSEIAPRPGKGNEAAGARWRAVLSAAGTTKETARLRMAVAREMGKRLTAAGADASWLDRPMSALSEGEREKLLHMVRKFTDGQTWKGLAVSYGIIKLPPGAATKNQEPGANSLGPKTKPSAAEGASLIIGLPLFEWATSLEQSATLKLARLMPLEDDDEAEIIGLETTIKRGRAAIEKLEEIRDERLKK